MILINDYLSFFYGINNCIFSEDGNYYYIMNDNNEYKLYLIIDLDSFNYLYSNLNDVYDEVVLNKYGENVSFFNNSYYVLIHIKNRNNGLLPYIPVKLNYIREAYWLYKWQERYFYYEEILNNIRNIDIIVDESIDYYLGLFYLAINYYSRIKCYRGRASFIHRYFDIRNYYDPMILKIDIEEREYSEYIKYLFFIEKKDFLYVKNLIDKNINNYNKELLFSRLVYPNYYFDLLDEILIEKKDPSELKDIIILHNHYECLLEYIVKNYLII